MVDRSSLLSQHVDRNRSSANTNKRMRDDATMHRRILCIVCIGELRAYRHVFVS